MAQQPPQQQQQPSQGEFATGLLKMGLAATAGPEAVVALNTAQQVQNEIIEDANKNPNSPFRMLRGAVGKIAMPFVIGGATLWKIFRDHPMVASYLSGVVEAIGERFGQGELAYKVTDGARQRFGKDKDYAETPYTGRTAAKVVKELELESPTAVIKFIKNPLSLEAELAEKKMGYLLKDTNPAAFLYGILKTEAHYLEEKGEKPRDRSDKAKALKVAEAIATLQHNLRPDRSNLGKKEVVAELAAFFEALEKAKITTHADELSDIAKSAAKASRVGDTFVDDLFKALVEYRTQQDRTPDAIDHFAATFQRGNRGVEIDDLLPAYAGVTGGRKNAKGREQDKSVSYQDGVATAIQGFGALTLEPEAITTHIIDVINKEKDSVITQNASPYVRAAYPIKERIEAIESIDALSAEQKQECMTAVFTAFGEMAREGIDIYVGSAATSKRNVALQRSSLDADAKADLIGQSNDMNVTEQITEMANFENFKAQVKADQVAASRATQS